MVPAIERYLNETMKYSEHVYVLAHSRLRT